MNGLPALWAGGPLFSDLSNGYPTTKGHSGLFELGGVWTLLRQWRTGTDQSSTNIAWTILPTMAIIIPGWAQQPSDDGAKQFSSVVSYCEASGVL
jgi:hypothetical protein